MMAHVPVLDHFVGDDFRHLEAVPPEKQAGSGPAVAPDAHIPDLAAPAAAVRSGDRQGHGILHAVLPVSMERIPFRGRVAVPEVPEPARDGPFAPVIEPDRACAGNHGMVPGRGQFILACGLQRTQDEFPFQRRIPVHLVIRREVPKTVVLFPAVKVDDRPA